MQSSDDHSNVSFVYQTLRKRFHLEGPSTELLLATMQEQNARVKTSNISGLEVLDYRREWCCEDAFSREGNVFKPEVAIEWEHLKNVADRLTPYHPDEEISISIGNNCPKAIRPRQIVAGGDDEPYALRTALGWGVIERACKSSNREDREEGVCNRVQVSEIPSGFAFSTKAKEIIDPEKALRVLETDFAETGDKKKPHSVED